MTTVRYAPGDTLLIVTDNGLVLLGGELPSALVGRIWQRVGDGRGLAAVLEALTGAFGTSLTAIPSFVVALREPDAVRVVVRGALTVTATTPAGSEAISGAVKTFELTELSSSGCTASPSECHIAIRPCMAATEASAKTPVQSPAA